MTSLTSKTLYAMGVTYRFQLTDEGRTTTITVEHLGLGLATGGVLVLPVDQAATIYEALSDTYGDMSEERLDLDELDPIDFSGGSDSE